MKKWSQYLKENSKKLLNEFNKKDEKAVMEDGNRFSVAFEIEMETEGDEDDAYEGMQEARREAAENYFGYDAEEHFREDVYGNLTPEQIGMEEPDDGNEMLEWYYDNTSTNPSQFELIHVALAFQDDADAEEVFDTAIDKILNDPMPFLKMIYGNSTRISELQDLLGWSDKQMTMGFELEGGKAFPEAIERIGASRDAMLKIIDYYLINLKSLAGRQRPGDIFPKSKKPVDMEKFVDTFSSQNMEWFVEKAHEALDSVVDGIKGRWGYSEIQTIVDEISTSHIKYWSQKIMSRYRSEVEDKADEAVDEKYQEFRDDPVQYLENMGYEEYDWFDEDQWRDNNYSGGGEYGCDVYDLESALRDHFPEFMSKYENSLKFEEDGSLTCGIEFSQDNPPYMVGLDTAIQYLEDFFEEYKAQDYFKMTSKTGLHTNIGYLTDEGQMTEEYNLFKALMFLNHTFATKGVGFPSREYSGWAGDLKKPALHNIEKFVDQLPEESSHEDVLTKKSLMRKYLSRNFEELSGILTNQVVQQAQRMGAKVIGFNVNYTKRRNYIEFRYPGKEDVNLESMTRALKYYAFIVKAAADPTFKQKEYIKDLVGFLNNLKSEKPSITKLKFFKQVKKGDLILSHGGYQNNLKKILIYNMIQATELDSGGDAGVEATWDAQDRDRVLVRRAKGALGTLIEAIPNTNLDTLSNNSLPNWYQGIGRTDSGKQRSVIIKGIRFDDEEKLGTEIYTQRLNPKSFQNDLDDRNYSYGTLRGDEDVKVINEISRLLMAGGNSIDFIKKLTKLSNSISIDDILKTYSIKFRETEGTDASVAAAGAEDGALTDELVDQFMNTISESESNDLSEVKEYFSKWKF
jgi:hypothetical protein